MSNRKEGRKWRENTNQKTPEDCPDWKCSKSCNEKRRSQPSKFTTALISKFFFQASLANTHLNKPCKIRIFPSREMLREPRRKKEALAGETSVTKEVRKWESRARSAASSSASSSSSKDLGWKCEGLRSLRWERVRPLERTLKGSFSAVSKPTLACTYSFYLQYSILKYCTRSKRLSHLCTGPNSKI